MEIPLPPFVEVHNLSYTLDDTAHVHGGGFAPVMEI
jgi:hypothetical protein